MPKPKRAVTVRLDAEPETILQVPTSFLAVAAGGYGKYNRKQRDELRIELIFAACAVFVDVARRSAIAVFDNHRKCGGGGGGGGDVSRKGGLQIGSEN